MRLSKPLLEATGRGLLLTACRTAWAAAAAGAMGSWVCRRRSAGVHRDLQTTVNTLNVIKRRHAGFASLPDDCLAAVLALVPFRER